MMVKELNNFSEYKGKFEKYLKHVPLIYVLYLPVNFFIHIYGAHTGKIMPVFMNILDLFRVLVIAAFSYYIAKTYTIKERKQPSERLMTFAGVSFMEWIINIVISRFYIETFLVDHIYFLVFFGITAGVGYLMETKAFYNIAEIDGSITAVFWVIFNVLLVIICPLLYQQLPYFGIEKGISNVILGVIAVRALIRAVILWKYVKKEPKKKRVLRFKKRKREKCSE